MHGLSQVQPVFRQRQAIYQLLCEAPQSYSAAAALGIHAHRLQPPQSPSWRCGPCVLCGVCTLMFASPAGTAWWHPARHAHRDWPALLPCMLTSSQPLTLPNPSAEGHCARSCCDNCCMGWFVGSNSLSSLVASACTHFVDMKQCCDKWRWCRQAAQRHLR